MLQGFIWYKKMHRSHDTSRRTKCSSIDQTLWASGKIKNFKYQAYGKVEEQIAHLLIKHYELLGRLKISNIRLRENLFLRKGLGKTWMLKKLNMETIITITFACRCSVSLELKWEACFLLNMISTAVSVSVMLNPDNPNSKIYKY
jgi:hypothetical protein